jgi:septal ring factor EnvC (AmiA/AmiB activator)
MTNESSDGLRARISRQGEDALGKLAQELIESPLVSGTISRAFEAREKAAQAQEVAMGALNLPSAADLERLTRRIRSVSHRLEGIEDGLDRVEQRISSAGGTGPLEQRLDAIEQQLAALATQLSRLGDQLTPAAPQPVVTQPVAAAQPSSTEPSSTLPRASGPTRTRAAAAGRRAAARPRSPARRAPRAPTPPTVRRSAR